MANIPTLASVARSVDYLRDLELEDNHLHVRRTGARIRLDGSFLRSTVSAIEIYAYLVGLQACRLARGRTAAYSIAFYPELAAPWYNIWAVSQMAGFRIVSDPHDADFIFVFEDATYSSAASTVPTSVKGRLINARIDNIGKDHVACVFKDVFGYDLTIDPTRYVGKGVRKSQQNGAHDGIVVDCPIAPTEVVSGYAYQKLVDSSFSGHTSEDLRIACVMGEIPAVFHKHKALEKRFGTEYISVDLYEAKDVFSADEIKKLLMFCDRIGLDFGMTDVMRDKHDGRIYVVDVNKTCMPVLTLPLGRQIEAMRRMSDAFKRNLIDA